MQRSRSLLFAVGIALMVLKIGSCKWCLCILCFFIFSLVAKLGIIGAEDKKLNGPVLTIEIKDEPLRKVLKKISEASGYEIRFNSQLADEKINLQLTNVTLNEAIARVLSAYNKIALWDDKNHILTLLIFKKDSPPVSLSGVNRIFKLATETTAGP